MGSRLEGVKGKLPHYFSTTPSYVKLKFLLSEIDIDKWFVIIINIHWREDTHEISLIPLDNKTRFQSPCLMFV